MENVKEEDRYHRLCRLLRSRLAAQGAEQPSVDVSTLVSEAAALYSHGRIEEAERMAHWALKRL